MGLLALAALTLLSACNGAGLLSAVTPPSGYALEADLAYGEHARQRLDLYRPSQAAPADGYPVVVFFYGGSWREGSRSDYRFVGQALAARGVMALLPDYRLYPDVDWRGVLRDSAAAVAWARREVAARGGNPERIVLVGHSAGGYNAAMLALDRRWLAEQGLEPTQLAGWAGLAGPYDFVPIENPDVIPVFGGPRPPADTQPLFHARQTRQRVPALLLAAGQDALVDPQRNSGQLAEALRAQGTAVRLQQFDALGHATLVGSLSWPLRGKAPVLDALLDFVNSPRPTR